MTNDSLNGRPRVAVRAVTANTCEIIISTTCGEVRILASHERIAVESSQAGSIEIEVRP